MASSEAPQRAQSLAIRSSGNARPPHRSKSQSQTHSNAANTPNNPVDPNAGTTAQRQQPNLSRSASRRNSVDAPSDRPSQPPPTNRQPSHQPTASRSRASTKPSNDLNAPPLRKRTTINMKSGEWALGKTIGAGSMGKVKLAKNLETGEQGAIKIVPRHSTDEHRTPQERERADASKEVRTQREAAIVTLVNHPYICGMRDVHQTNYHWYMVFEYVNGGQMLDYIISHGKLKEKQARKFARQIASALDYCHRNSIVHRDLKIENILISKEGNIKIIDFGLSNMFSPRSTLRTFCGSLYFAAPELLQARAYVGPEVDIWSFGIVLYVLVCGKVPFDDQSMPQLHSKIKKGLVDYPPWLSNECRHLISRMLVTDPKLRAPLHEILHHPWMTKGFGGPPENFLPYREPLQLPLDDKVVEEMRGFDFGPPEYIKRQLLGILSSEEYQKGVKAASRKPQQTSDNERKKGSVFDFYQRRKSNNSKDTLTTPSNEALPLGEDPINAFSPMLSVYYMAKEKQERDAATKASRSNPTPAAPPVTNLAAPEPAYTNSAAFEMAGEAPTGGRSRPRARTHGEDDYPQVPIIVNATDPATPTKPVAVEMTSPKKESSALGLIRRFSTRRYRDPPRATGTLETVGDGTHSANATVNSIAPPRSSFSAQRARDRDAPPSAYNNALDQSPGMLSPHGRTTPTQRRLKGLGRSTSMSSGDFRRRWSGRRSDSATDGQESDIKADGQTDTDSRGRIVRTPTDERRKSLNLGQPGRKRDSIQAQERIDESSEDLAELRPEASAPTTAQVQAATFSKTNASQDVMKPVYLKGLFSVSTTSSKPLTFIRQDIIRVLTQLGVEYREMKSGFSCRHVPSIDLQKVVDHPSSEGMPRPSFQHRRKISFAGIRGNDSNREPTEQASAAPATRPSAVSRSFSRRTAPDGSYTTDDEVSEDETTNRAQRRLSHQNPRVPGGTTTHVQSDLGQRMILRFEILVVKVPLLSLHGLQFKKVDGGTWQYKKMAENVLALLNL